MDICEVSKCMFALGLYTSVFALAQQNTIRTSIQPIQPLSPLRYLGVYIW